MNLVQICRRSLQVLVIAMFCLLPWLNGHGLSGLKGSLFALEVFGLPLADPAGALQALAGGLSIGSWPLGTVCLGAGIAILGAMFFGRVFCGWLCPYGFFSELVHAARGRLRFRAPVLYPLVAKFPQIFPLSRNIAFLARIFLVLLGLAAVFFFGFPLLLLLSLPGELSLLPIILWRGAGFTLLISAFLLPLCALFSELVFGKRLWCRYVCPQSVLLGFAAWGLPQKLCGLRIRWAGEKCTCGAESPCLGACSISLNPRRPGGPDRRDCMMCGKCVAACGAFGKALGWGFGREDKNGGKRPEHCG